MRKVEIVIERRTAPDAPRLDAPVRGCGALHEVGAAAPAEQQRDIALQRWLVALGGEVIMALALNNMAGELALSQQRIARNVAPFDVTQLQQRDGCADLVGALLRFPARDGQRAYFFWA